MVKSLPSGLLKAPRGAIRQEVSPVANGRFCLGNSGGQDQKATKIPCEVVHGSSCQFGVLRFLQAFRNQRQGL